MATVEVIPSPARERARETQRLLDEAQRAHDADLERLTEARQQLEGQDRERVALLERLADGVDVSASIAEVDLVRFSTRTMVEALELRVRERAGQLEERRKDAQAASAEAHREELVHDFEIAEQQGRESGEKLAVAYAHISSLLFEHLASIDHANQIGKSLGSPYPARAQKLLDIVGYPSNRMLAALQGRGYKRKVEGFGNSWILQVIPLLAPAEAKASEDIRSWLE